jgi:glycosyltransferase involved in cell wall biosynthesis
MPAPIFSFIVPAHNAAAYVQDALASMMAQSFTDFECIVIDDGSSDETPRILRRMAATDSRLKVVSRPNRGLVATLNELISLARGRYLARMDADDRCHPDRLARQFEFLEAQPDCVAVGANVTMIDPSGRKLKLHRLPSGHEAIVNELLEGNGGAMIHPAVTIRASALAKTGPYSTEYAGYGEDWDLYLRLSQNGRLANLGEPLLDYRLHHKSYNHTRREAAFTNFRLQVNTHRARYDRPPLKALPHEREVTDRASVTNHWATCALEGGEVATARSLLLESLRSAPLRRATWKLLKYSLQLKAHPQQP